MTLDFPVQDLTCPDPSGCTVAVQRLIALAGNHGLQVATYPSDRQWFRVYDAQDGCSTPNPGYGDTRFAPFDSLSSSARVPTLYLAESLEGALLETCFHDVHISQPRVIAEQSLFGKLHARLSPPQPLELVDLRDERLIELNLVRSNLSSSPSEHYPCTRRIARAIHHCYPGVGGILWHSRQAELTGMPQQEVMIIFADRIPSTRDTWNLEGFHGASGALLEGTGRLLLDSLAEKLDLDVISSG